MPPTPDHVPARLVVLVSGAGTNLQALIDACGDTAYGARVVAVGADRDGIEGLARAERAGIPTFVRKVGQFTSREHWDLTMTDTVSAFEPDLVVLAGFMKLVGASFLDRFAGRVVNTHPALSPSFPGMHGAADALEYGVKVTGATLFVVDEGVDTGPIIAQTVVPVPARADQGRRAGDAGRLRRPDCARGHQRHGQARPIRWRGGRALDWAHTTGAGGQPPGSARPAAGERVHRTPGCPHRDRTDEE